MVAGWLHTMRKLYFESKFVLSRDAIIFRAKAKCGPKSSNENTTISNDKVHLIGILLRECNLDNLPVLVNKSRPADVLSAPRDKHDNPSNKMRLILAKIATQFNRNGVILLNFLNWPDARHELEGYDNLDPNDGKRIFDYCDSMWAQKR